MVAGVMTFVNGQPTGSLPGGLIRNPRSQASQELWAKEGKPSFRPYEELISKNWEEQCVARPSLPPLSRLVCTSLTCLLPLPNALEAPSPSPSPSPTCLLLSDRLSAFCGLQRRARGWSRGGHRR